MERGSGDGVRGKAIKDRFLSKRSILLLILITSIGLGLRMWGADRDALNGDEIAMGLAARGVKTHGHPIIDDFGPEMARPATTSETVPYLVMVSVAIWGETPMGYRFHSMFLGALCIVVTFFLTRSMFNEKAAWVAALIQTILPPCIKVSQWARYPSTLQFFILCTTYFFWKYISSQDRQQDRQAARWYLIPGCICYLLSFFSWEGSAFYFIGLFATLAFYNKKNWKWLIDPALISVGVIVSGLMYWALLRRAILTSAYMIIGTGAHKTAIKPLWLFPTFDLLFYVKDFFLSSSIWLFSFIAIPSLIWRKQYIAIPVLWILILVPILLMTTLLELRGFRYAYYLFPYLAALSGFVVAKTYDAFNEKAAGIQPVFPWGAPIIKLSVAGFILLIFLIPNSLIFRLKPFSWENAAVESDIIHYSIGNNKNIVTYLKNHYRPGDKIISFSPHQDFFYLGKASEFFYEDRLQIPLRLSPSKMAPVHQLTGSLLIYSENDFLNVLNTYRRVWIVMQSGFSKVLLHKASQNLITQHLKMVSEGINFEVYLWDH